MVFPAYFPCFQVLPSLDGTGTAEVMAMGDSCSPCPPSSVTLGSANPFHALSLKGHL